MLCTKKIVRNGGEAVETRYSNVIAYQFMEDMSLSYLQVAIRLLHKIMNKLTNIVVVEFIIYIYRNASNKRPGRLLNFCEFKPLFEGGV